MQRTGSEVGRAGTVANEVPFSRPAYGDPQWPLRLTTLIEIIQAGRSPRMRDPARGQVWHLLNAVISKYIRVHMSTFGRVSREEIEDAASQKSLELLSKIERGSWNTKGHSAAQITSFLSSVARNGLIDALRRVGRFVDLEEQGDEGGRRSMSTQQQLDRLARPVHEETPLLSVERQEFVQALLQCVGQLNENCRTAWFLRVFCGLSSKEISVHPEIRRKASHVDVMMQRTRAAIGSCMAGKGQRENDLPPGTFFELWKAFRFAATGKDMQ